MSEKEPTYDKSDKALAIAGITAGLIGGGAGAAGLMVSSNEVAAAKHIIGEVSDGHSIDGQLVLPSPEVKEGADEFLDSNFLSEKTVDPASLDVLETVAQSNLEQYPDSFSSTEIVKDIDEAQEHLANAKNAGLTSAGALTIGAIGAGAGIGGAVNSRTKTPKKR